MSETKTQKTKWLATVEVELMRFDSGEYFCMVGGVVASEGWEDEKDTKWKNLVKRYQEQFRPIMDKDASPGLRGRVEQLEAVVFGRSKKP